MDVQSEEAARRRVAIRDEVSAAQVAQSAASQEWVMARDASHRAHAKVAETESKMEAAMDALAQAQAELKAGEKSLLNVEAMKKAADDDEQRWRVWGGNVDAARKRREREEKEQVARKR
eukprot:5872598-Pleurochrysis_carterae.AAC.1